MYRYWSPGCAYTRPSRHSYSRIIPLIRVFHDRESHRENEQDQKHIKRNPKRVEIGRTEPAGNIQSREDQCEQQYDDKEQVDRESPIRLSPIAVHVPERWMHATASSIHVASRLLFALVPAP